MQDQDTKVYYIVVNDKATGPFSLNELINQPSFRSSSLVWRPGLANWIPAKELPELSQHFEILNNNHIRPAVIIEEKETPPEFADNPQYRSGHSYRDNSHFQHRHEHHDNYEHQYAPGFDKYQNRHSSFHTNWLPWAIVATVIGFFTSCIGAIFGIIGIVQASKANTMYSQGYDREGDTANSTARIMTIIGLVFATLGILAIFWWGSIFNTLLNYVYF